MQAGGDELVDEVGVVGVEVVGDEVVAERVRDPAAGAEQGIAFAVNAFQLFDDAGLVKDLFGFIKTAFSLLFAFHNRVPQFRPNYDAKDCDAIYFFQLLRKTERIYAIDLNVKALRVRLLTKSWSTKSWRAHP